jgi:hypothetical protein
MMEEEFNPYSFTSTDIVVWNKVIATFGSISNFVQEGDDLRIATDDEKVLHKSVSQ